MRRALILLTALIVATLAIARPDHRYRKLTMSDGLASNAVRNIIQDDQGYIWLGTDNGLCRYDGHSIQTYRIAANTLNQYISSLIAGDDGLYAGTDQGVYRFSVKEGRFDYVSPDINSTVTHLAFDRDGQLWVAMADSGVYCYQPKTAKTLHYAHRSTGGHVDFIMVDRENRIWTISNASPTPVAQLNRLHDAFEHVPLQSDVACNGLCMMEARDGRFYLGTWTQGLLLMNADGQTQQVISPQINGEGFHIHTLYQQSDDRIYIGCDDGLLCYNPTTGRTENIFKQHGISDRFVYSVTTDTEGGLWTGTFYAGVNYFSPQSERFSAFTRQEGLTGNVISRFCEDRQGTIWMASDDGGLMRFLPTEQRFATYPHQDELSELNAHALAIKGSELWIGSYTRGVYVLNTATGQLRHYEPNDKSPKRPNDKSPKRPNDNSAYAILHDSRGRTWIGGMRGLTVYKSQTDEFEPLLDINSIVIDIDEDRNGTLWLSTQGNGLWHFMPDTRKCHVYRHNAKDRHSLPDDQVNCAMVDATGRLWIGTMGGLCYYDAAADRFVPVTLSDETVNVMGIVEQAGSLWLSTEHGLLRYEPKEASATAHHFTIEDGLVSEQFIQNACLKASDGRIFFGSANGFCTFFPYNIKANITEPPVYITSLEVMNRLKRTTDGLPLDLTFTHDIEFAYAEARMLSFSFVSLSYCSPGKNHYAYMLEGFDREWNYVGTQHKATYTNLPAGTYTLRVKATNNDGVWSSKEARLKITVNPPLWWSWWAKLAYLIIIVAAIWYYAHIRLVRAERMHQRELLRVKEDNEQQNREARLRFFTMIAHEIRTPVSLIIGPLEKLMKRSDASEDLRVIDRNAHRLLELVGQLLDFRKVEQQSLKLSLAPTNIRQLLEAVAERFSPTFSQRGITFTTDYPDSHFTAIVDPEAVTKVVSNLLTNASKYTRDSVSLTCIVEPDDEHFRIIVTDNGVGIRPEDQERIFEPFFQSQGNKPGTGIGLSIVRDIIDRHHGTIQVNSELGQGATFTVILPVVQETESDTATQATTPADSSAGHPQPSALSPQPSTINPQPSGLPASTILIVEDNADMLEFLAGNFADRHTVYTAADGIEALDQLTRHQIDIIISDWMMPRMDGATLCRRVRSHRNTSHIPFVMLTAKTDDASKVQGMDVGADIYVEKPFSLAYLEACIRNVLTMRRRLIDRFTTQPLEPVEQIASNDTDSEFLEHMKRLIEDNISSSDLNVNFLVEHLNISRSGLFAKIKSLADITPNEMIQVIRLKRAAVLLREGQHTVSEVCYMVGFSNPSYFSKCFLKQFGIRPGDFAKSKA